MKRTRIYQEVQLKHNKENVFTRLHHQKPLKINSSHTDLIISEL